MAWYNTRIGGKLADFFDSAAGSVAMTFFVPFGFIKTGVDMYDSAKEAARAQEEAEKQSRISNALNGDISSLPYIKGAKNTTATGKTQPYIIGRHLFTPYIMNGGGGAYKGWHKIGGNCGSEQYYGVVLEGGFAKQVLECLNIGDVKAADFSGDAEPQEGVRRFKADSVFASPESFIEISQDGNGFEHEELNRKIVEAEANAQLKNADDDDYEDLIYTLDKNAMSCDITIMFNGLYAVDGKGNKTEKKRTVVPSWSSDYLDLIAQGKSADEATWHEFKFKQATEETNVSYKTSYYTAGDVKGTGYQSKGSIKLTDSKKNNFINKNRASWTKKLLADKSSWTLAGGEDIKDGENVTYDVTYTYKTYKKNSIGHTYDVYFTPQIKATQRVETKTESSTLSNDFSYNRQSQIRFNAHADFSFSDCFEVSEDEGGNTVYTRKGPIAVRISTADTKDDKARGDCYVQYVQSTCCNEAASKASGSLVPEKVVADREARLSTLIGVYIKATEANKDKLDKISVVTNGTAPYLDETGEWAKDRSGELLRRPTSNIAAWTLEILTSSTHTPSKMESGEIDLDTFRKWHEYCDENGLFVNKVLTGGAQKESLLASLAEAGRAVLYQDTDGRISVAWDRLQDKPKMLLNAENMVSFSWKKDLSRQPDGVKMTFIESEGDVYDTDSIIRMYEQFSPDGEDQWADSENRSYDAQIKEIEGYGITGHEQACAYMDYVMRCARLRLKDASCQIGKEGAFLRPYDRVSVQHWAIGRGDGSTRVKSVIVNALGSITGVETYDPVMMGAGESFYAQIQCTGGDSVSIAAVSAKAEKTRGNEILFTRVFTGKISAGDIVSYGVSENIVTEDFIVRSAQPSGKGYALTLTEYDERIFETGEIPDYESPLSLNGDVRRVNLPESVPEYTSDELNTAIISVTSPYVHVVYCDDPETGENYSTSETRAYVGTYSDTETEAAGTFEEAKGKPGIKWAKFVDTEAAKAAEEAAREAANVVTHGAHFTTMHRIKDYDTNLSIENIQRKIDADFEELSSGMSMTEAELHWFTEKTDAERGTKTTTEINAKAGELQTLIKETDETNRTDTASEIKQTASEIKTTVGKEFFNEDGTPVTDKDGNVVKVGSVMKQTADEIYSYVGNDGADGKPKSGIFQTADAIQASVEKEAETRSGETKALGEKADGIDKDLQDTKEEYTSFKSTITQTADAIQASVEKEAETRSGETKALGEKADGIDKDLQDTKEEYTSFKSTITQTAENIQLAVTAEAETRSGETKALGDELGTQSAKLDVQSGAVQAIVTGGGSSGYLGLSTELPVIIWGSKYESIKDSLEKSQKLQEDDKKKERTEAVNLLESVYVKTDDKEKRLASDGKGYYTISEDASASDCRKLFDYMKKAGLLASQFKVSADQMEFSVDKEKGLISFNGQTIFSSGQTSAEINSAKTAAVEAAATDATNKRNTIANNLGYSDFSDMANKAAAGNTVIKGGYINTTLISAKSIDVDGSGFFQKVHSYDTPESNFWDLSTGEFRIGNDISLEDSSTGLPKKTGNGATYIHFNPKGSRFTLALTKFVLSSIASIIKGVFKVNADSETGIGSDFLTVNPDGAEFDGVPAKAVSVKGDIIAHGQSSGDTSAKNHVLSRLSDKEFDGIFSIS